ncbi:DUF4426 domain-containing protein [Porticoccaceae bacterium]|jgi:hypothetical protein|nr:DUF4426 domain-containing protein [Porticoccaceae bacterium]MDB9843130.1 DUF4426 domain-containing protein [Porticoccaceae bacterium]MDC1477760.1 DUF4426 domain-containing protein [Porticoccaceae bacterium]|tara:strand:+ start:6416 stop:6856 length:441 start_codon:yes stop_codon:yes gene_type:complete
MKSLILAICLVATGLSHAVEEKLYKQTGDYKIFHSAFNSSFITPEIAVANNIVRGKDKGLVNIAVAKIPGIGLPAVVTGTVSNILQQSQTLEFFAVREQNTVYYLAPFEFDNEDFLTFKIRVLPESDGPAPVYPYDFKFQKKMYID